MFGYVLQDWTTIRGQAVGSGTSLIQNESDWMGFSSFQDMVFWIDLREATFPTGSSPSITLALRTAPSKDDVLFQTMFSTNITSPLTPGLVFPSAGVLPRVILASGPSIPLSTWVRWELTALGTAGPWDLTFRILLSANRVWK